MIESVSKVPMHKNKNFYPSVFVAALILLLIIIPLVQALVSYRMIRYLIPLFILWLGLYLYENHNNLITVFRGRFVEILLYLLWSAIILFFSAVANGQTTVGNYFGSLNFISYHVIQISICYFIGIGYSGNNFSKFKSLAKVIIIGLGVNQIFALPLLITQNAVIRLYINSYQTSDVVKPSLLYYALGPLGFYCCQAIISPIFLALMVESKKKIILYLFSLFFCIITIGIFLSTLLVVIFTFVICFAIFVLYLIRNRKFLIIRKLFLLAAILILLWTGFNMSENYSAKYSIGRISYYLKLTNEEPTLGNTYNQRLDLYTNSFKTIVNNPILGIGPAALLGYYSNDKVGGHSGILDGFAIYGLLFGFYILFLMVLYKRINFNKKYSKEKLWPTVSTICFIGYLIVILLDPMIINASVTGIFLFIISGLSGRASLDKTK